MYSLDKKSLLNLDRLAESIRVEIDQVEKQMGLRPGALGTPDQAAAYKGDADRFSQELFDRYETLQKQLVNISTAKQTKGLADALRTEAQKAAESSIKRMTLSLDLIL